MLVSPAQSQPTPVSQVNPAQLKATLVESATEVNIGFTQRPLELVLHSAIDEVNLRLEPEFGANALQNAIDSGVDFSPEAVAERIVSFATGFYSAFSERHADLGKKEQLSEFMGIIRDAIDQGFAEAREVLSGLNVLNGDIESNVDKTYSLVQDGLDRFESQITERFAESK